MVCWIGWFFLVCIVFGWWVIPAILFVAVLTGVVFPSWEIYVVPDTLTRIRWVGACRIDTIIAATTREQFASRDVRTEIIQEGKHIVEGTKKLADRKKQTYVSDES